MLRDSLCLSHFPKLAQGLKAYYILVQKPLGLVFFEFSTHRLGTRSRWRCPQSSWTSALHWSSWNMQCWRCWISWWLDRSFHCCQQCSSDSQLRSTSVWPLGTHHVRHTSPDNQIHLYRTLWLQVYYSWLEERDKKEHCQVVGCISNMSKFLKMAMFTLNTLHLFNDTMTPP